MSGLALVLFLWIGAPATGAPMSPEGLATMLDPAAGWASHVEAARRAEAAGDPDLIPGMFAGFVAAKRGTLQEDPDIHERLLFALERFPVADVVERLKAAPVPSEIAARTRPSDYHGWLDAIAADRRGFGLLRVVQGDGLNLLIDGPRPPALPRPPSTDVPGGDADASVESSGSFLIPTVRLPSHPESRVPWILASVLILLGGLIVLAGLRPGARPTVFRILAVALAPLGVLALEASLTLGGMEPLSAVRPNFNLGADRVGMRWFEPIHGDAEWLETVKNNARYQRFSSKKSEGTVRVVVLGGSSVRGKGDLVEYAWPSVLQRRLQACAPAEVRVEVINVGADGALSDDLAVVARNFTDYDPDVYVVYTGYNDFVFVPLLTRFEGYSAARMGLRYALGRTRTAHLLARWTGRLDAAPESAEAGAPGPSATDVQVTDMRRLLTNNLSLNLRRVARTAREAGALAFFVTQGQNEDICGSGALNGQEPWDGSCFPTEARRTVLQAASAESIPVVDAAAALRADAEGRTVGWSHFWDEIHPGRRGSAVIGEAIAPTVRAGLWAATAPQDPDRCRAAISAR